MVQTVAPPLRMTYEEYERWVDDRTHSEWVDGEVTVFMPPIPRHVFISMFLSTLFNMFVDLRRLGVVGAAPFEMRLRQGGSYREPDLLVVLNENLSRIDDRRLDGPADVVLEILSKDNPRRDLVEKHAEYEAAGIPEYWIVEGRERRSGVWLNVLQPNGRYARAVPDDLGRLRSTVLPGFWIDPAWLEADPLPSVADCLRAIIPDTFGLPNPE